MVHDRHMSLYYEYSVIILVMATDVPGMRTLISGTCLLILPDSVPVCCRDWYMLARPALHFFRLHPAGPPQCGTLFAPERHARSKPRQSFIQVICATNQATSARTAPRPCPRGHRPRGATRDPSRRTRRPGRDADWRQQPRRPRKTLATAHVGRTRTGPG